MLLLETIAGIDKIFSFIKNVLKGKGKTELTPHVVPW